MGRRQLVRWTVRGRHAAGPRNAEVERRKRIHRRVVLRSDARVWSLSLEQQRCVHRRLLFRQKAWQVRDSKAGLQTHSCGTATNLFSDSTSLINSLGIWDQNKTNKKWEPEKQQNNNGNERSTPASELPETFGWTRTTTILHVRDRRST